jgi:Mg2+/Co2+ transporter CorC
MKFLGDLHKEIEAKDAEIARLRDERNAALAVIAGIESIAEKFDAMYSDGKYDEVDAGTVAHTIKDLLAPEA